MEDIYVRTSNDRESFRKFDSFEEFRAAIVERFRIEKAVIKFYDNSGKLTPVNDQKEFKQAMEFLSYKNSFFYAEEPGASGLKFKQNPAGINRVKAENNERKEIQEKNVDKGRREAEGTGIRIVNVRRMESFAELGESEIIENVKFCAIPEVVNKKPLPFDQIHDNKDKGKASCIDKEDPESPYENHTIILERYKIAPIPENLQVNSQVQKNPKFTKCKSCFNPVKIAKTYKCTYCVNTFFCKSCAALQKHPHELIRPKIFLNDFELLMEKIKNLGFSNASLINSAIIESNYDYDKAVSFLLSL